jgi:hypothetical protein
VIGTAFIWGTSKRRWSALASLNSGLQLRDSVLEMMGIAFIWGTTKRSWSAIARQSCGLQLRDGLS